MAHVGARIPIRRRPRDVADRPGEQVWKDALSLDDAAVAKTGLARRLGQTVDERDGSAARLKRERRRDADNSGAKHDDVDRVRRHGAAVFLDLASRVARAALGSILEFRSYRPRPEGTNRKRCRQ